MPFKRELANAVQLFILLSLLLWSFTWNSGADLEYSNLNSHKIKTSKFSNEERIKTKDTSSSEHFIKTESFSKSRHVASKSSNAMTSKDDIIPPFNEWREIEKIKYEKVSTKDANIPYQKKVGVRKLNYASSKCGAKILGSNPEAKHRLAVLNEKPDEYMMNPCRVRTWFVIELCDTVEATQVEIANYELYSSSAKEFSVFWSEVYPTTVWHLLGSFEAKDQRKMQTFNLNTKNLGKFIKVIIYSHHGKEHYCLMSLIRILGYSMVEKFEEIQESVEKNLSSDKLSGTNLNRNLTSERKMTSKWNATEIKGTLVGYSNIFSINLCFFYLSKCKNMHVKHKEKICQNKAKCQFFMKIFPNVASDCENTFCFRPSTSLHVSSAKCDQNTKDNKHLRKHFFQLDGKSKYVDNNKGTKSKHECTLKVNKSKNSLVQNVDESRLNVDDQRYKRDRVKTSTLNENVLNNKRLKQKNDVVHKTTKHYPKVGSQAKCSCERKNSGEKITIVNTNRTTIKEIEQEISDLEIGIDSAGLIQKESVLFKLTSRIKTSEMDLELINKYLQHLSQSYRQQMQDMQIMFNRTVKAINVASEMSRKIDKKQQESINALQQKVTSLTIKVDYLMSGQRDMLIKVAEMHAFFIILEIIIISTILTVSVNVFNRKIISIKY